METTPCRIQAYQSLTEPLTPAEVARELGTEVDIVEQAIAAGQLRVQADGTVTGHALAAYLQSTRISTEA